MDVELMVWSEIFIIGSIIIMNRSFYKDVYPLDPMYIMDLPVSKQSIGLLCDLFVFTIRLFRLQISIRVFYN